MPLGTAAPGARWEHKVTPVLRAKPRPCHPWGFTPCLVQALLLGQGTAGGAERAERQPRETWGRCCPGILMLMPWLWQYTLGAADVTNIWARWPRQHSSVWSIWLTPRAEPCSHPARTSSCSLLLPSPAGGWTVPPGGWRSGGWAEQEQMELVPAPVCLSPSCPVLCLFWGWLPAVRAKTGGFYLQGLAD